MIEYQRISDVSLVPNVCVGSKEEVLSVVLVSRKQELSDIETVALDESSRTSATLVKVIFREFIEREHRLLRLGAMHHQEVGIAHREQARADADRCHGK